MNAPDDFTFDATRGFRMADRDGRSWEAPSAMPAACAPSDAVVSPSIDRPSLSASEPDPWLMLAGEWRA